MQINSLEKLIQYLKSRLGEPIIRVEITEEQYKQLIYKSIKEVTYYLYDGKIEGKLLVNFEDDKYEYQLPSNVYSIDGFKSSSQNSLFINIPQGYILNVNPVNMSFLHTLTNIDIVDITSKLTQLETITSLYDVNINYSFNTFTKKLTLFEKPSGKQAIMAVSFEYIPNDENDYIFDNNFVQDLALAYAYMQWANNIGKYQGQLLNGSELNYNDIQSKGETLYQEVMQRLKDNIAPLGMLIL